MRIMNMAVEKRTYVEGEGLLPILLFYTAFG